MKEDDTIVESGKGRIRGEFFWGFMSFDGCLSVLWFCSSEP